MWNAEFTLLFLSFAINESYLITLCLFYCVYSCTMLCFIDIICISIGKHVESTDNRFSL